MYCAYHGQDHPEGTVFTIEHVIPYGLGGSNQFAIQVCQKINNDVGSEIDAPFQKILPVAYERFIRNLKSYSGEEPSILFRGTTTISGRTIRIEYEITQSEKNLVMTPSIHKEKTKEGLRYNVQTTPDQFDRMLRDMERKGMKLLDDSGNVITRSELLARTPVQNSVPEISCHWNAEEWSVAAKREFIKIALGTAHFFMGERYSRSEGAERLRKALYAPEDELRSIPIRGSIWPSNPRRTCPFFIAALPQTNISFCYFMLRKPCPCSSIYSEICGE